MRKKIYEKHKDNKRNTINKKDIHITLNKTNMDY